MCKVVISVTSKLLVYNWIFDEFLLCNPFILVEALKVNSDEILIF